MYLHSFAFTEISLRNGNSHCFFVITVLLVGGKEDLLFYSAPSSSVKRDCWGIKVYACVSGSSQLISLKYSRLGCCSICWGGGTTATWVLSGNTASRFQQSARQLFSGFLVWFPGIFPGVVGGYALHFKALRFLNQPIAWVGYGLF